MDFIEKKENKTNIDNLCIILTSTVYVNPLKRHINQIDPQSRIDVYLKSIKQWLDKTNFKIILVENSGYDFPELSEYIEKYKERFELILFKEKDIDHGYLDEIGAEVIHITTDYIHTSKGASEMFAIYYAKEKSQLAKNADFFIKITCRYFIPTFENYLQNINIYDYHVLRQNDPSCCEIVGAHKDHFREIFIPGHYRCSDGLWHHHVEDIYKDRIRIYPEDKILICEQFDIEPTPQGGVNNLKTFL